MPDLPVAGPAAFVTLYEVAVEPTTTTLTFKVNTDQAVQLRFRVWRDINPGVSAAGQEASAKVGPRSFPYALAPLLGGADPGGWVVCYEITSITAPPPTLRPFQGSVRVPGSRTVAKGTALNVRWNAFGWNRYTWAQYNPKNENALVTP